MKKIMLLLLGITILFSSCATILSHSSWPLQINTEPSGAKAVITDKQGITVNTVTTPAIVSLKSGAGYFAKQFYTINLSLDGYQERTISIGCSLNEWYLGNLLIGGAIGMLIIDPITGAMYKLDRAYINETLSKTSNNTSYLPQIVNINQIPEDWKTHLIVIE
jgi:uncharacterized protein YceK